MKNIKQNLIILFILISFVFISFTNCDKEDNRIKLMIYTSIPQEIIDEIKDEFESKYPQIELLIFRKGTSVLREQIKAETQIGGIKGDIVWIANIPYYEYLKKEGLLIPYDSPEADSIPSCLIDSDHCYYPGRLIGLVIAYNPTIIDSMDAPKNWQDLTDEEWMSQVVMGNAIYSGMLEQGVGMLANNYGWEYFEKLKDNDISIVKSNTGAAKKVITGEFPVAITLDYTVRMLKAKGEPIELIYPNDGIVAISSPIAMFASTKHPKEANLFIDYILSKEGQEMLVKLGYFMPIRDDVGFPIGSEQFNLIKILDNTLSPLPDNNDISASEIIREHWNEIMLE